jgi:hypothetical protein
MTRPPPLSSPKLILLSTRAYRSSAFLFQPPFPPRQPPSAFVWFRRVALGAFWSPPAD